MRWIMTVLALNIGCGDQQYGDVRCDVYTTPGEVMER